MRSPRLVSHVATFVAVGLLSACTRTAPPPAAPMPTTGATATSEKAAAPTVISYGEQVSLTDHLVTGKTTIFDFSSPFCPPCQEIAPLLADLHQRRDDLAVVTVNINRPEVKGIDWGSPVARQYNLESVPSFVIYGPDGVKQLEGEMAKDQVVSWLQG